jgi:magnesium chelatase family protein
MQTAKLFSRALTGMEAPQVIVEVHVASGLPSFAIVGLADTEVRESRDRVRSAIQNSGYDFPARRITVNLAPADLPKDSGRYDLPIALGILIASKLIKPTVDISTLEFAGELALDGELRQIKGALAIAYGAHQHCRQFILPTASAKEAALINGFVAIMAGSLTEVIAHISSEKKLSIAQITPPVNSRVTDVLDFAQVKGQLAAKKALEIAAAGRHSLLMLGNPGCGKSMLAARMISILPLLAEEDAMVSASLHSLAGNFKLEQWRQVPFRCPHHSSSSTAIVGGGSLPKPGEVSLAHAGILFLDELPEFDRNVLEALREPLESKKISIARVRYKVEYCADFQLLAAMNPCPCGNQGHIIKSCQCSPEQITRYRNKVSGPLLDRIDMMVALPSLKTDELQQLPTGESSSTIAIRVASARQIQYQRQQKLNYLLNNEEVDKFCAVSPAANTLLQQIIDKYGLSARGYYRLLKLARTIADLDVQQQEHIQHKHLLLAGTFKHSIE